MVVRQNINAIHLDESKSTDDLKDERREIQSRGKEGLISSAQKTKSHRIPSVIDRTKKKV